MSLFSQMFSWFGHSERDEELRTWFKKQPPPPILFSSITHLDKPPRLNDINEKEFYYVSTAGRPKWVLFRCPCGCNSVITLSLQKTHTPHWTMAQTENKRPVLYPSVWRDTGCMSHFWINDGRVYWCPDTGVPPLNKYYSD